MTNAHNERTESNSFDSLALEYAQLVRRGENPDINKFARRNEKLASQVLRLFPVLELMEQSGVSNVWSEAALLEAEQQHQKLGSEKWTAPEKLGDFRLIKQIGRGGMGIVYEAQQESLGRRVAIKILPSSAQFDERRMERFATEAKASAMLHHTNIVPIFGIGREEGLSFIVMQLIHGQPLNRVLQDISRVRELSSKKLDDVVSNFPNREIVRSMFGEPMSLSHSTFKTGSDSSPSQSIVSTTDKRLAATTNSLTGSGSARSLAGFTVESSSLLQTGSGEALGIHVRNYFRNVARVGVKVSEALDHAHNRGILHRDIKPSNLLLDEQGAVWVTDFGLAKYFDSPDLTRTGEVVGTLRYMSPEQLDGNASTSSDIFGLGLTLYEMLTLQPAYPGIDKKRLLERVSEANPVNPRSIDSRIPRDLETVVMKCIHSEPSKRYASATDVSNDLTRFLEGQPILARRIGTAEKAWKWCRRRPALATTIAALAASILLGVAGVGWQWNKTSAALSVSQANFQKASKATHRAEESSLRAQEHFNQARAAVVQITESISNEELLTSPDLLHVRRRLLYKALDFHIEFVKSHPGDTDVEFELANAWLNLATVSAELQMQDETKDCLENSRSILETLLERELAPLTKEKIRICLAENYSLAGQMAMREAPDGQYDMFKGVRVLMDGRNENELSNSELSKLADLHRGLGGAFTEQNVGRPIPLKSLTRKALEHYTKSFELTKILASFGDPNKHFARMIAKDHRVIGMANRRLKNKEQALMHYTASVDQFRELVAAEPDNTDYRYGLAEALSSIAFYYSYAERDSEVALEYYHQSIDEYEKLANAYPSLLKFVFAENKALMNCCIIYERESRSREAVAMRKRTLELARRANLLAPNDPKFLSNYGKALQGMGVNCTKRKQQEEAWEYHVKAREQHEKAIAIAPMNPTYQIRHCQNIISMGIKLRANGDYEGARQMYLQALEQDVPETDVFYITGRSLLKLARRIKDLNPNASETDLEVADASLESAKEIFAKLTLPEYGIRARILSDRKFKPFVTSELGKSFLQWFDTEIRLAEKNGKLKTRR